MRLVYQIDRYHLINVPFVLLLLEFFSSQGLLEELSNGFLFDSDSAVSCTGLHCHVKAYRARIWIQLSSVPVYGVLSLRTEFLFALWLGTFHIGSCITLTIIGYQNAIFVLNDSDTVRLPTSLGVLNHLD